MTDMPPTSSTGGSYTPPSAPPPGGTAPVSSDRQLMLVLSYIFFLGVVPLIARGEDRELRWHALNGLALFGAYFILSILWWIFTYFVPIPCAGGLAGCAIFIAYIALAIFGIMKALKGQRLRLPVLSDFADR